MIWNYVLAGLGLTALITIAEWCVVLPMAVFVALLNATSELERLKRTFKGIMFAFALAVAKLTIAGWLFTRHLNWFIS